MCRRIYIIFFVFGVAFSIFQTVNADNTKSSSPNSKEVKSYPINEIKNFVEVYLKIKENFVSEIDDAAIINNAIKGMIDNLDPYSTFLNAEQLREFKGNLDGRYGGVGLEIAKKNGEIIIVTSIFGGPAYKAGIKSGDRIIQINDLILLNHNLAEVDRQLKGAPNSQVKLFIENSENKISIYNLTRKSLKRSNIFWNDLGDNFIHVRIAQFLEDAAVEITDNFKKAKNQNINGLIIDLRDNPGGLLEAAIKTIDLFLSKGTIVSIEDRSGQTFESYIATPPTIIAPKIPIIVIINNGTASAAEIMASALKDNKRALLIGTNTFGKGSVQSLFALPNNSAAKITTAFYLTPSGKKINIKGITPDIPIESFKIFSRRKTILNYNNEKLNLSNDKNDKNRRPDFSEDIDYALFQAVKALQAITLAN